MKSIIIGAGITGITTAYYLSKNGHDVTIFDKELYPAMQCSFANGGQISVSNSEVWTTKENLIKGLKWMMTKDAPLLIRPKFDFNQWKWIGKFVYNSLASKYEENTSKTIQMGIKSREIYEEIINQEQIEFDRKTSGIVHIYKDYKQWEMAKIATEFYKSNGLNKSIMISPLSHIDNALTEFGDIYGSTYTESDWSGDIHKFTTNLMKVIQDKYNVKFVNSNITSPDDLKEISNIVICAGVGSKDLAKMFGDNLNIYPVKGYSITITVDDASILPDVAIIDDQAKIVTSTLGNRFRVAGTAELDGYNYDIRKDRVQPLLDWVHHHFPKINTHNYSSWACLRPMTPDMLPIVKRSDKYLNLYYNTGHGHLGFTLAPYTAKEICSQILGMTL